MTLREIRKQKGFTLRSVGEKLGTTHNYIYELERTANPGVLTLKRYADAIGEPLSLIVESVVNTSEKSLQSP